MLKILRLVQIFSDLVFITLLLETVKANTD